MNVMIWALRKLNQHLGKTVKKGFLRLPLPSLICLHYKIRRSLAVFNARLPVSRIIQLYSFMIIDIELAT